jgi:hypothetical protein
MKQIKFSLLTVIALLFITAWNFSCKKEIIPEPIFPQEPEARSSNAPLDPGFVENDMVIFWNDKAATVLRDGLNQPSRSRYFAIIQIAVHDALNNIKPKYRPYALLNERTQFASPDAAVASAAYWAIKGLNRQGSFPVDTWYNESLATIPDGESKELGKTLGKHAAEAIIANRANDGFTQTIVSSLTPPNGTNPGEYRSTMAAVNWIPTQTQFGFRILSNWGIVMKPYVVESNHQFRPEGPYAVTSSEYTTDFNEVKSKGARDGSTRTEAQNEIGKFWTDTRSSYFLNLFVRKAVENKKLDAWRTARLFALVHVSVAETVNTMFEANYHFYYWRPETAIRLAATDNNDNSQPDLNWLPAASEGGPTVSPPLPGYPSSFASFIGAAMETLRLFFETDETFIDITTTSINPVVTEPRTSLHFSRFSEIARSNSLAMIYNGWDFRKSALDGEDMGRQIANYVFNNSFGENPE